MIAKRRISIVIYFIGLIILLFFSVIIATTFGAKNISFSTVLSALFNYDITNTSHHVISTIRFPRVLAAIIAGVGFAISGAIIQGVSRNPLADTGLFGLNAGAGLLLVIGMIFIPSLSFIHSLWLCILGALLGAALVFGISMLSPRGMQPIRLVLAGAAISTLLVALSEAIGIYFSVSQQVAFWYGGGLSGIKMEHLAQIFPFFCVGTILSILLSKHISMLSLGEEVAQGLGVRITLIKSLALIGAFILAGISCAIAGAISFVGLLCPHIVRYFVGADYRLIIPLSGIVGAILVVFADLLARILNAPYEVPVGAILGIIGVPFFIMIARKERQELS